MKVLVNCAKLVKNIHIPALIGLKKSDLCYITQKSYKIYTLCKDNKKNGQNSCPSIFY